MPQPLRLNVVPLALLLAMVCLVADGQTPSASPQVPARNQPNQDVSSLSLDQALRLATTQATNYQSALLNERIAAEDVRQAQAAFRPRVSVPLNYIYTTPAFGLAPGEPRVQSFIANDAIGQYQAFLNVSGDFDIAGRLRATLAKNRALLA